MPGGSKLVHLLDSLQKEFVQENAHYTFFLSNLNNPEVYNGKGDFESWIGSVSSLDPPPTNFNSDLNLIINELGKNDFAEITELGLKTIFKNLNFHFFISAKDFITQNSRYYLIDKLFLAINSNLLDKKPHLNIYLPLKEGKLIQKSETINYFNRRDVKIKLQFF
jgi:hypothetical protein